MTIEYLEPLSRAFQRMKSALFKPFDLGKWFAVGFTAFLAGLLDGPGGGGGGGGDHGRGSHWGGVGDDFGDFLESPGRLFSKAWEWLIDHHIWLFIILFGIVLVLLLVIVFTWLSSRGRFMFLDNVVHDRAEVVKPWKEFRDQAYSLFLWRLVYGFICFLLIVGFIAVIIIGASAIYRESHYVPIAFFVFMGLFFLFLVITMGYISVFLSDFVVPIMYKHRLTAMQAWSRFLSIFGKHPFHFILYGLFVFFLVVFVMIGYIIAGALTCCIGLLLIIIPYIGTVVTLPLWYTCRAFSLEYLAQFGPEFQLFPPPESEG
jgi:MFS family permease